MSEPVPWPTEVEEEAIRLWEAGKTAGEIAVALDRSRNAIIGKLNRLGIIPSGRAAVIADRSMRRVAEKRERIRRTPLPAPRSRKWRHLKMVDSTDEGRADLISILDLTRLTCRWPIGDPKEPGFGFCGRHSLDGEPYCAEHHVRSHDQSFRVVHTNPSAPAVSCADEERTAA